MKKRAVVIGYGQWGKILCSVLKKHCNIVDIFTKKKNYRLFNYKKVDWVFVLTSTESHYEILFYLLNNYKNLKIFCEKPLVSNYETAKSIIKLSKISKNKIFISNVEEYKFTKLILRSDIITIRKKLSSGNGDSIFLRLMYHDIYVLYKYLIKKKYIVKGKIGNKTLKINLYNKNIKFSFFYSLSHKGRRVHKINNYNFEKKKNALDLMINRILYKKISYKINNLKALFCLKFIEHIKKKLNYEKINKS